MVSDDGRRRGRGWLIMNSLKLKRSMPGFKASMIRSGPRYSRTIVREGDVFGANFSLHVYRQVSRSRVKREHQPERRS